MALPLGNTSLERPQRTAAEVQMSVIPSPGMTRILPPHLEAFLGIKQRPVLVRQMPLALPAGASTGRVEREQEIAQWLFQRFVAEAEQQRVGGWSAGDYARCMRRAVVLRTLTASQAAPQKLANPQPVVPAGR